MEGTIMRMITDRGFGFIRVDDGTRRDNRRDKDTEVFFHRSAVLGSTPFEDLREGTRVTFEPTQTDKGPRAEQVRPID